jgi:hypothetical protein
MWLFKAKKRYGLRVLNYMAASNHIIWSFLLPALDGSPSARAGQWGTGDHPKVDATDCRPDSSGVQPKEKEEGSFLGRSLSCDCSGNEPSSYQLFDIH